jgi:hypothetical protein
MPVLRCQFNFSQKDWDLYCVTMFNWKPYQAKAVAFRFYYGDV